MPRYYRIHPFLSTAATPADPGHPLYVYPHQGGGRIDNPSHYLAFYIADSPMGAIAEVWGRQGIWSDDLLAGSPTLTGSVTALSTYEGDLDVVDLDDASTLLTHAIRPSRVVTRNYPHTQAWALAVFSSASGAGIRWWSYHDPDWGSLGIWDTSALSVVASVPLTRHHPAVVAAGSFLSRRWLGTP